MADLALQLNPETMGTPDYGDLLMQNGDLVLTSPTDAGGTDGIVQLVIQSLRLFLAEWFMDQTAGVPYLQLITQKGVSTADIDAALKAIILGVPGVLAMTQYQGTAHRAQRLYQVRFTIVTATGRQASIAVPVGA